jgi:hypothetical protein
LTNVTYTGGSVATPSTTYTYDRRGRRQTAVRNSITTTWTYNDPDKPLTETHSGGTLASLSMTWTYDNALRRDVVTAKNGTSVLQAADYDYDTAKLLQGVVDGGLSASYAYHPNSTLIATLALTNGPGTASGLGSAGRRPAGLGGPPNPSAVPPLGRAPERSRGRRDGSSPGRRRQHAGRVRSPTPSRRSGSGRRYRQNGTEVAG